MIVTLRSTAALAVLLAATGGCKKESAIDRVKAETVGGAAAPAAPSAPASADPVQLSVTVADAAVALGDDIVFRFKLTNTDKSAVQVNVPRLDKRSASFRVRRPGGGIATVTRIRAELSDRGEFVYDAPNVRQLAPGESLEQDVSVVAIESGKLAFTPIYVRQGAVSALTGATIDVDVTPADPKAPRLGVKLETSHGPYTAVFRPDVAFNTVESFATLVKRGYYTGLKFHRILAGFMAQGGDPKGTGEGGPGYFLPLEANLALRHTRGVMSMARTNIPDTAGSQFFIMFATRPDLDQGRYTTFAQMVDGEETVKRLESVPVGPSMQGEPSAPKVLVQIQSARLVTLP